MLQYHEEESSEDQTNLEKLQKMASTKQASRVDFMGELLRSKGFFWLATSHYFIGGWQQAGNVLRFCLLKKHRIHGHNLNSIHIFQTGSGRTMDGRKP